MCILPFKEKHGIKFTNQQSLKGRLDFSRVGMFRQQLASARPAVRMAGVSHTLWRGESFKFILHSKGSYANLALRLCTRLPCKRFIKSLFTYLLCQILDSGCRAFFRRCYRDPVDHTRPALHGLHSAGRVDAASE